MVYKSFLIICFISVSSIVSVTSAPAKTGTKSCQEQLTEVDRIMKLIFMLSQDQSNPIDEQTHKTWCKDALSLGKKVARYARCEKPFPAQVLGILANGVKKPAKFICNEKKQYSIENYKCMNEDWIKNMNGGESYYVHNFHYIINNASSTDVLPLFCCNLINFYEFLKNGTGSPKCSSENIHVGQFFHDRIYTGSSDVADLVCSTYKSVQMCDEKVPQLMKIIRTPPPQDFDPKQESLVGVFLGAVARLT